MGIEGIRQSKNEKKSYEKKSGEKLDIGEEIPEEPDSLRDILDDPKKSVEFGTLLNSMDSRRSEVIFKKYSNGENLSESQLKFVNEARFEYKKRLEIAEDAIFRFTPKEIENLATSNPLLGDLVGINGAENITEILHSYLPMLAMKDKRSINRLDNLLQDIEDARDSDEYTELDSEVSSACTKYGISDSEYVSMVNLRDRTGSEEALREKIKDSYGWFKQTVNLFSGGKLSRDNAREMFNLYEKADSSAVNAEIDRRIKSIATLLSASISNDEAVFKALNAEVASGKAEYDPVTGKVTSPENLKKKKEALKEKGIKDDWGKFKASYTDKSGNMWADISGDAKKQDAFRDEFLKREKSKHKDDEESGFFSSILKAIVDTMFNNIKKDLV
jgi:hypothetical protein